MKKILQILFVFPLTLTAQSSINAINVSAISTNLYSHSIGEIFVNPVDLSEASSGGLGALSSILSQLVDIHEPNLLNAEKIYLYPNPVSEFLVVGDKDFHFPILIKVIDMQGKECIVEKESFSHIIDISNLPIGSYWLQLIENNYTVTLKFIKI